MSTPLEYATFDSTLMGKEPDTSKALTAKRESKHIEFKEGFNPSEARDWCEIIKDIVAMANSGGGFNSVLTRGARRLAGTRLSSALLILRK